MSVQNGVGWVRTNYTGTIGYGDISGPGMDPVITEAPYQVEFNAWPWPPVTSQVCFLTPEAPDDKIWGEQEALVAPDEIGPVLAIGLRNRGGDVVDFLIRTNTIPIAPANNGELLALWAAGIDIAEPVILDEGWLFVDLTGLTAANKANVLNNGIMFCVNHNGAVAGDYGLATLDDFILFEHYFFPPPDSLIATSHGQITRLAPESALVSELENQFSNLSVQFSGKILKELRDQGDDVILLSKNIAGEDVFFGRSIDIKSPWIIKKMNTSMSLSGSEFESDVDLIESLDACFLDIDAQAIVRGGLVPLAKFSGFINDVVSTRGGVTVSTHSNLASFLDTNYWPKRIGAFEVVDDNLLVSPSYDWAATGYSTFEILYSLLVNTRTTGRMQDFFTNDWVYLLRRFNRVWRYPEIDELGSQCEGMTVREVIEMVSELYNLFYGISQQGNILVWHPACYRDSLRLHELNLDKETAEGGHFSKPIKEKYETVRLKGDFAGGSIDESLVTNVSEKAYKTGNEYLIEPTNAEGNIPLHAATKDYFAKGLLNQHSNRLTGKTKQLDVTIGQKGLLFDVGDQVRVTSTKFNLDEYYMVTNISPSLSGGTKVSMVHFEDWPAAHSTFTEDGPLMIIRDAAGENKTWRATGAFADFVQVGGAAGQRQGSSWEGEITYSGVYPAGGLLRGAVGLSNSKYNLYDVQYGGEAHQTIAAGAAFPILKITYNNGVDPRSGFVVIAKNNGGGVCNYRQLDFYAGWCPDLANINDPLGMGNYVDLVEFEKGVGSGPVGEGYVGSFSLVIGLTSSPNPDVDIYHRRELVGTSSLGYAQNDVDWEFTEYQGWSDGVGPDHVILAPFCLYIEEFSYPPDTSQMLGLSGVDKYFP